MYTVKKKYMYTIVLPRIVLWIWGISYVVDVWCALMYFEGCAIPECHMSECRLFPLIVQHAITNVPCISIFEGESLSLLQLMNWWRVSGCLGDDALIIVMTSTDARFQAAQLITTTLVNFCFLRTGLHRICGFFQHPTLALRLWSPLTGLMASQWTQPVSWV